MPKGQGDALNQARYRQPPPASMGLEKNGLGWANSHFSQPPRPSLWPPWWSVLLWGLSSPVPSDLPVALLRVILNKQVTRQPHSWGHPQPALVSLFRQTQPLLAL